MTNKLKSANIILFDLLGVVLKKDDPLKIVKRTLQECRLKNDDELLKKQYEQFIIGKLSENEFWNSLNLKDYSMPRKLVLERLEYSLDDDFVKVLPSFGGKRIGVKGNLPLEWVEEIFDSSGLSSMIQVSLFSYNLGKKVEDDEVYQILTTKFPKGSIFIIESNMDKYYKDIKNGLNSSLFIRKPMEVEKELPPLIFKDMEDIEKLLF